MFFAEDCSVTDATFEDEILKIVKLTQGFGLTCVCIKEMLDLWFFWAKHTKQQAP